MADHSVVVVEESFPVFEGEPVYLEGYVPSSLDSQHSSLLRTSTWLGMGFILTSLAFFGTFVFGLGAASVNSQEFAHTFTAIGAIGAAVCLILGFSLIHRGRRYYRAYVARTGRRH